MTFSLTRRVHIHQPFDVYCGRFSHIPYKYKGSGDHGEFGNYAPGGTVAAFRPWFQQKLETDDGYRKSIEGLRGKRLACFCAAGADCHVDVIVEHLESTRDPEQQVLEGPAAILAMARRLTLEHTKRTGKKP